MTGSQSIPLLSPEEIVIRSGQQIPFLHLPTRAQVFSERETRLWQRAASHPMRDYLIFITKLARVQHEVLQSYPSVVLPSTAVLDAAARAGQPSLPATDWPRDPRWRTEFRRMVDKLLPLLVDSPARSIVCSLLEISDQELEQQADRLIHQVMFDLDMAAAPLIAAGLQIYWTHMVLATQEAYGNERTAPFGRTVDATLCPCCGSPPSASVSRIDTSGGNYRFLHCSLCSTQWHMVRIKCSHCESTKGIHYHSLQPIEADSLASPTNKAAIEAETCDECRHYLKIVRMERDPAVEPVADDLASVTLDLLVAEAGFQRHGVNLMLLFGDPNGAGDGGGG